MARSKKFSGAIAELLVHNDILLGRTGGVFEDWSNLIGLDVAGKGQVKETFKVKLEFKNKIGAASVAGTALRVGLGGLKGLGGGGGSEDVPVAISIREGGIAVVRGKQHILAFDPATKQIPWSVQYAAPGVSGWEKIAMMSVTAFSYANYTAQAASTVSRHVRKYMGQQPALAGYSELQ